ncbi:MAG: His-Xaa-Ser system radical SAM maturase HxsB [Candidatus Woesearchaeota archaeon]
MDFCPNYYRVRDFGDKCFLTTDHGSYCVVSKDDFRKLQALQLEEPLLSRLVEREIVLTEKNIREAIRLAQARHNFLFSGTSLHIIVATLRCNMNCLYCQSSSRPADETSYDMDVSTATKVVDFIFQSPRKNLSIEFQGGEPLLNWDVVLHIIRYAKEKSKAFFRNVCFSLVTNLVLMDDDKMKFLVENDVGVCTSLDGPREIHDSLRRLAGGSSFEHVAMWVPRLNSYYRNSSSRRRCHALLTLARPALLYPEKIVDSYASLGFGSIHIRPLNNLGVAQRMWPELCYPAEEFIQFWKRAISYIEQLQSRGVQMRERIYSLIHNKILGTNQEDYLDLRSPCGAAIGQLAYNYNGDIYTCDEARMVSEELFRLGNVKEDNYKDVLTCDKACAVVNASINDQYYCNECAYKPYCGICPVCNYVEQGSVIAKIPQTDRCKIYRQQFDHVVKEKFINDRSRW